MALIDHIDTQSKRIFLSQETANSEIHPIELYKEVRVLRRDNESLRRYNMPVKAYGNVPKSANKATERYVILQDGYRVVPYDASHMLTITGTIITDDMQEGIYCFDRSPLGSDVVVDINYVPPQVEVIVMAPCATGQDIQSAKEEMSSKIDTIESGLRQVIREVSDEVVENQTMIKETGFVVTI